MDDGSPNYLRVTGVHIYTGAVFGFDIPLRSIRREFTSRARSRDDHLLQSRNAPVEPHGWTEH